MFNFASTPTKSIHRVALAPALFACSTALLAGSAMAGSLIAPAVAAPAQVAPGAPMRQVADYSQDGLPTQLFDTMCTQGPNGTVRLPDGRNNKVMITAAHCTGTLWVGEKMLPGVYVPLASGDAQLGEDDATSGMSEYYGPDVVKLVQVNLDSADWSVVAVNPEWTTSRLSDSTDAYGRSNGAPVEMTGVKDFRRLRPHEVSVDNFGEPICKDGAVSGRSCGTQLFRTNNMVWSMGMGYAGGDSGGNNFDPRTGEVIGVTSASVGPFDAAQPVDTALEDAYGIPDGRVNDHFTLSESTAPHDRSLRTAEQDRLRNEALRAQSPQAPSAMERLPQQAELIAQHVQNTSDAVVSALADNDLDTARHRASEGASEATSMAADLSITAHDALGEWMF